MLSSVASTASSVQWAYVVGGEHHQFKHIQTKLLKEGINTAGHADPARDVALPKATTFVLLMDHASHSATEKAKLLAEKFGVPVVYGSFTAWSITKQRLIDRGIIVAPQSPLQPAPKPQGFATFADKLSVEKRAELEARFSAEIEARFFKDSNVSYETPPQPATEEVVAQEKSTPTPVTETPAEPTTPAPQPEPEAPLVPPVAEIPQEETLPMQKLTRNNPDAIKQRRKLAEEILGEYEGYIQNAEVNQEVTKRLGYGLDYMALRDIRKKHGYPLPARGGHAFESRYAVKHGKKQPAPKQVEPKEEKQPKVAKPPHTNKLKVADSTLVEAADEETLYEMIADFMKAHKKLVLEFVWDPSTDKVTLAKERVMAVIDKPAREL